MMRTPKLAYSELIICCRFVKLVMPRLLYYTLYEATTGCIVVGSKEEENKVRSVFYD